MAAAPPSAPHPRSRASVTAAARRWLGLGLDLVYPPHCAFCHEAIANSLEGLLCPACRAAFVDHRPACSRCGALGDRASGSRCTVCSNTRFHFGAVARLGAYEGPLRQAVLRLKHASQRGLAIAMGDWLAVSCSTQWPKFNVDAVVPVPMHWSRKMWRGANSPETIAERVANRLRLPTAGHLLVRNRRTAPQASLPASRRAANVRGAFRARRHRDLAGARLLLVDDVMTTGATLNEAAKVLRRAGAQFVAVAVLARADSLV